MTASVLWVLRVLSVLQVRLSSSGLSRPQRFLARTYRLKDQTDRPLCLRALAVGEGEDPLQRLVC